jgi:hypothetical protein
MGPRHQVHVDGIAIIDRVLGRGALVKVLDKPQVLHSFLYAPSSIVAGAAESPPCDGMTILTTWEADRYGYFQGNPTAGQLLDRFIALARANLGRPPRFPNLEINKDHWRKWPEGSRMAFPEAQRKQMVLDGRLPDVEYTGNHEDLAQMKVMTASHVFVEMLDTDRRTRHRCIHHGTLLIASREGWEASLKSPT